MTSYNPFSHVEEPADHPSGRHPDLHAKDIAKKAWSAQFLGSPLVWLAVTLVMIAVGFGWLEKYVKPRLVSTLPQESVAEAIEAPVEEHQSYDEVVKEPFLPISTDTDDPRAEEYRRLEEAEAAIEPLLTAAQGFMDGGQLTYPPSANAWESYGEILNLDSEQKTARAGQKRILAMLDGEVETAIEAGDFDTAGRWIDELDRLRPGNPAQALYRQRIADAQAEQEARRIAEEQQRQIDELLARARAEMDASNPVESNALLFYRDTLEIDPKNEAAKEGIKQIADNHLSLAASYLQQGEFEKANTEIRLAGAVDPGHEQLIRAKRDLSEARNREQAALQAAELRERQAVEEQRRREEAQRYEEERKLQENLSLKQAPGVLDVGILAYYRGDYAKAYELLQPLAADGVARAQFRVGMMYFLGRGMAKNQTTGEQWIAKALPSILSAAQKGSPWAQTDLGTAYEMGITLKKDMGRAVHWYTQAAERGYAGAQTNLGVLYGTGDGVTQDRGQAIQWFKRAAQQGDTVARENLKAMNAAPTAPPSSDLDKR
ncbi:MAG: hypothetical protein U9Q71_05965 [Pseudomonadota bacterium]|nr:hypothetical protein [Pseudomonadota bacterium]